MQTIDVPSRRSVVPGFSVVMVAGIATGSKLMGSAPAAIDVSWKKVSASRRGGVTALYVLWADCFQEAVVRHHNQAPAAPAGHSELRPVGLTDKEVTDLIAFLRALEPITTETKGSGAPTRDKSAKLKG